MNKVLISVLGSDQPGIMARIATVIKHHNGNIENLTQTLLDSVFGALLMVKLADNDSAENLQQSLQKQTSEMNLYIRVHPWQPEQSDWHNNKPETQPYIVTAIGPDRHGLVAEIASELFQHGINISHIQAIFKGGKNPMDNLMVFEVEVPQSTIMNDLREGLDEIALRLDLEINLQHRKIFESVSHILN